MKTPPVKTLVEATKDFQEADKALQFAKTAEEKRIAAVRFGNAERAYRSAKKAAESKGAFDVLA